MLNKSGDLHTDEKQRLKENCFLFGEKLSFEASEAYKLLRTNISFSFPQSTDSCKIIGTTSSIRGEGKSLTSVNLAYSMALDGKNVLLIECDLRLPSLSKKLNLKQTQGLSNILVGLCSIDDALQSYGACSPFWIITSGDIPPNPSELLGSERMKRLLTELRKAFDYIIIDLPPVTVVVDALVINKYVDGMIIVVREKYTDRTLLTDAVRQLKFANANILGFVYNCVDSTGNGYGSKHYYKHYGYKYGYGRNNGRSGN